MGLTGGVGASFARPGNMITTTSSTPLTDRDALSRTRATFEALYQALSDGLDGEDRERLDRIRARGVAALNAYTPTGGFLPGAAAETLGVYLDGAANGDPDAKLAWLKMMPRMLVEVTAGVEAPLVFEPANWLTFEALNTRLQFDTNVVLSHRVSEVQVAYSGMMTVPVTTWKFASAPFRFTFDAWFDFYKTLVEPVEPVEPAKGNRQSALALAA